MTGHIVKRGARFSAVIESEGADGKRRQKWISLGREVTNKTQAKAELVRILAQHQSGTYVAPAQQNVREYLEYWIENYAKPKVQPRTLERYEQLIATHINPALGTIKLSELQPSKIQETYTRLQATGRLRGGGGLSAQSCLHIHRLLHTALKQAVRWQLVARNVCEAVEPPRPARPEIRVLDEEETLALLEAAEGHPLRIAVLLAVTMAFRLGETLALTWSNTDLAAGTITVSRSLEETRANGLRFKDPKTAAGRRNLRVPDWVVTELRRHKARQAETRLLLGAGYANHDLIVCQDSGEPIIPTYASKAFARLAAKAGLPEVTYHGLRHSSTSVLIKAGVPIRVVSARLGHANTSTTMNIYSHMLKGQDEQAAAAMEQAYETARGKRAAKGQSG